ncbi:MAG: hypothetical protein MSA49_01930 [Clostridia bacterium]|nr:hypothetical protein [Clostridia bacterium]
MAWETEYTCLAQRQKRNRGVVAVSGCWIGAVGFLAVAYFFSGMVSVPDAASLFLLRLLASGFRGLAILTITLGVLFGTRYVATEFVYSLLYDRYTGQAALLICALRGKRSSPLCRIPAEAFLSVEKLRRPGKKKAGKSQKEKSPSKSRRVAVVSYCPDMFPKQSCLLTIQTDNKIRKLRLQPDDTLFRMLLTYTKS